MLWRRSLVMRDLETGSLWSHLMGKAMEGPLKGADLRILEGTLARWGDWRKQHPKTTVLAMSRTAQGFNETIWKQPDRFVYGVRLGPTQPKPAVTLTRLLAERVVHLGPEDSPIVVTLEKEGTRVQALDPTVDGRVLSFRAGPDGAMQDQETGSSWDPVTGVCRSGEMKGKRLAMRPGMMSYRKAWSTFYPDDTIVE